MIVALEFQTDEDEIAENLGCDETLCDGMVKPKESITSQSTPAVDTRTSTAKASTELAVGPSSCSDETETMIVPRKIRGDIRVSSAPAELLPIHCPRFLTQDYWLSLLPFPLFISNLFEMHRSYVIVAIDLCSRLFML